MRACNEISHRLILTVRLLFTLIYVRKDFQERIINAVEVKYDSVTNLTKTFDIGRTLATSLVMQMQSDPEFKDGVISISHKKKLVNIELFEAFLKTKINGSWIS